MEVNKVCQACGAEGNRRYCFRVTFSFPAQKFWAEANTCCSHSNVPSRPSLFSCIFYYKDCENFMTQIVLKFLTVLPVKLRQFKGVSISFTENIRLKHLVSNDSSDSEDESQHPKGKEMLRFHFIISFFHQLLCGSAK